MRAIPRERFVRALLTLRSGDYERNGARWRANPIPSRREFPNHSHHNRTASSFQPLEDPAEPRNAASGNYLSHNLVYGTAQRQSLGYTNCIHLGLSTGPRGRSPYIPFATTTTR